MTHHVSNSRAAAGLAVLAVALTTSGCVIDSVEDSAFDFSWQLQYTDGVLASCGQVGTPWVRALADNVQTGAQYTFDFPCGRGRGRTGVLPAGSYQVVLQLVNEDDGVVTVRAPEVLAVNPDGLTVVPVHTFAIQRFAFFLDWKLSYVGGGDVTCAQAGAATVALVLQAAGQAQTFQFPCENLGALSPQVTPGVYTAAVFLQDAAGGALAEAALGTVGAVAEGPTDLGFIEFPLQSFVSSWSIEKIGVPGVKLSCAQVGAVTVEIEALLAGQPPFVYRFPCADMTGATTAVPIGSYAIAARLLDAQGAALSTPPPVGYQATAIARAVLPAIVFGVN